MKLKPLEADLKINKINISASSKVVTTNNLISNKVDTSYFDEITPKGFARPTPIFKVLDFISENHKNNRQKFSHKGDRVEVNILDTSDIKAAIEELKKVEEEFNKMLLKNTTLSKEKD